MNILIFEDGVVDRLSPASTGRAAMTISCAGCRLIDLIQPIASSISVVVRAYLAEVTQADFPFLTEVKVDEEYLCVNARIAPTHANMSVLKSWAKQHTVGHILASETGVMAAIVRGSQIATLKQDGFTRAAFDHLASAEPPKHAVLPSRIDSIDLDLIDHLHDLVRIQCGSLNDNLQRRIETGRYTEIADGVYSADPDMSPGNQVVTCTRNGPVVIETGCTIGPFTFLEGPVHLGSNCKVAEHSSIKDCVSTGPTCKLGGEIEATIIEGFSNKQHHGFLGHSYLGSWINLGAGTCNSDLKNTYGKVNMNRDGQKISTGMQFVGCFIGDYAKTAINTSIFTGKTIGVCSMVYGFAANDVAAFTNDARLLGKVTAIDPGVMIQTQARMFGRRKVTQRDCDITLIQSMFQLTSSQRNGLPCEPLVFDDRSQS